MQSPANLNRSELARRTCETVPLIPSSLNTAEGYGSSGLGELLTWGPTSAWVCSKLAPNPQLSGATPPSGHRLPASRDAQSAAGLGEEFQTLKAGRTPDSISENNTHHKA